MPNEKLLEKPQIAQLSARLCLRLFSNFPLEIYRFFAAFCVRAIVQFDAKELFTMSTQNGTFRGAFLIASRLIFFLRLYGSNFFEC